MVKEIEGYRSYLKDLHGQITNLLEGLSTEALDWKPIEGTGELETNSIGAMVMHLAGAERYWMKEIIGGQPIQRDREAEFASKGMNSEELMGKLDESFKVAEEILSNLSLAELGETRKFRDRVMTVRVAILYVIGHFAAHLGHMQLTRQLWQRDHK